MVVTKERRKGLTKEKRKKIRKPEALELLNNKE
jgi:hypothetical protein